MIARSPLELAHHHPGRLRVRSDALCRPDRDPAARQRFENVRTILEMTRGVRGLRLAADAGSILVEYEPGEVDPNELIDTIADAADLEPPLSEEERAKHEVRPSAYAIGAARRLDRLTRELTGGRADLRDVVPMAMTAVAAYAFVTKKERLPRWDNLVYWAYSIFLALHTDEIAATADRVP